MHKPWAHAVPRLGPQNPSRQASLSSPQSPVLLTVAPYYLLVPALTFLILIYASMSSRGLPATQTTQPPGKPPPARSGAATRKQTASYASLTTGRTKEDMLTNPAFSSSINTPESARKYLVDHFLLAMNQDPVHPSLSTAYYTSRSPRQVSLPPLQTQSEP